MRFLLFIITVSSIYSTTFFGYLKQTEMSFCMDECAQYYIETEVDPAFGSINVILDNLNIDINVYMNRFVEVELGEEERDGLALGRLDVLAAVEIVPVPNSAVGALVVACAAAA